MGRLLWFNPQNDLALAADVKRYTPPAKALRLSAAAQLLPMWYGEKGDMVKTYRPVDSSWLNFMRSKFDLEPTVYHGEAELIEACEPWGWSKDALCRFVDAGISPALLPTAQQLDYLRLLSHRRTSITLQNLLSRELPFELPPQPIECRSVSECLGAVKRFNGEAFIKLPYSSTGRGVFDIRTVPLQRVGIHAENMLRRQGSVMVEKALDKIRDFAMLFRSQNGVVKFMGYSAFEIPQGVSYSGNILMPDDMIRKTWLGQYVDPSCLSLIEKRLEIILGDLIGGIYTGYLGIDMMLYAEGNEIRIDPCVELNLRMTMGVVAHIVGSRYIQPGVSARMTVFHNRRTPLKAATVSCGRLVSGEINLTEPDSEFSISLAVI